MSRTHQFGGPPWIGFLKQLAEQQCSHKRAWGTPGQKYLLLEGHRPITQALFSDSAGKYTEFSALSLSFGVRKQVMSHRETSAVADGETSAPDRNQTTEVSMTTTAAPEAKRSKLQTQLSS